MEEQSYQIQSGKLESIRVYFKTWLPIVIFVSQYINDIMNIVNIESKRFDDKKCDHY